MKKDLLNYFAYTRQAGFIKTGFIRIFILLISILFEQEGFCQPVPASDQYYFYTGEHPSDATPSWGDAKWATGGITHDADNWYIGSTDRQRWLIGNTLSEDWAIWRWPVTEDLDQDLENGEHGVITFRLSNSNTSNAFKQYGHIGDLDCFKHGTTDYLAVPLTGGGVPIIAFFRARDLRFINYSYLNNNGGDVGWCAVNPINHDLYTSNDNATEILRYHINWPKVAHTHSALEYVTSYPISPTLHNMQGGEFTPDGRLLYVSCGIVECDLPGHHTHAYEEDGIHVFDTLNWHRIEHSTNHDRQPDYCFDYAFDNYSLYFNDSNWDPTNDDCYGIEPEGLTIWDTDGRSPGVNGQLHVLVDDHNPYVPGFSSSTLTLKHYRSYTKCPDDITVIGTSVNGVPATNPAIAAFLNHPATFGNDCAVVTDDAPSIFPPGSTTVTFTITNAATVNVKCAAKVNIVNKHDECSTALRLYACDKTVVDNYCANPSNSIPPFSCYNGEVKDVWFKIYPSSSALSVETYQVAGGLTNTVMQAFSGSCGNLHEIACDDNSGDDNHAKITITDLPDLKPIYIRVTDNGGHDYGKFGIYYQKIEAGSNIFSAAQFAPGDGDAVHEHPALEGDMNGDGKTDIVFVGQNWSAPGLNIRTKMSDGNGTYTSYEQIMPDGAGVHNRPTLTGDINGDGKTDIIFLYQHPTNGLTVRTKMSNGNGTYTAYEQILGDGAGIYEYPPMTGDVNGDGKTDLIFAFDYGNAGLTIRTKISNGNGTFTEYEQILGDGSLHDYPVLTGDVNGDGRTDLIFAYQHSSNGLTIRTKMSNGNGTYTAYEQVMGDGRLNDYPSFSGDVNGDGKTDLIYMYQHATDGLVIRTKMSNGNGTYTSYQQVLGDGARIHDYPAFTGDVNGDGKTDLIFNGQDWQSCGLNIRVKISKGDGSWCEDWQPMGDGDGVHQQPTLAGDMNGDGKTDLVFIFNSTTSGLNLRTKFANLTYSCNSANGGSVSLGNDLFNIYPNPTKGIFQIITTATDEFEVSIMDVAGRLMMAKEKFTITKQFNISMLANGVYFVDIYDSKADKRTVKKLVKMR